ncbi:uncharacterized protein LOC5510145 isoform X2 [Nematostella vectensis]|uniref:uncharacterized protein LOC5510145 isoform X2 n=1 Tax=Nematostella vectensis TaxID=45351 RepID=UPI002076D597|nr:uncharacterized protein LOC5510145 isoform X2 [Nematostella vectensis]
MEMNLEDQNKGQYCIYKKGSCPSGFSSGWIRWDDEDVRNSNNYQGTLPDGTYDRNTLIYFCCRSDGSKTIPIPLPTETPFFLLAQGSASCQQVQYAVAVTEWLRFDTEDVNNGDGYGGSYPYGAGINDHTMHYCYYKSCAYIINGSSNGTLASPNFPKPYPNGQICSWSITIATGSKISLNFTTFLLQSGSDVDSVQVFDGSDVKAPSLGVFSGVHSPPSQGLLSSGNQIFVLFKSDSSNSDKGFEAWFKVWVPPTRAPTSSTVTSKPTSLSTRKDDVTSTVTTNVTTVTPPNATRSTRPYTEVTQPNVSTTKGVTQSTSTGTEITQSTIEITKKTTEVVTSITPTGSEEVINGSALAYRKSSSRGVNTVTIIVPTIFIVIIIIVLVLFFVYRRRRKNNNKTDKKHLVFFNGDPSASNVDISIDNPLYDVGGTAKAETKTATTPPQESDPNHGNPFSECDNPLYDSSYGPPVENSFPNKGMSPTMHLEMNDDVMAYQNELYKTRMPCGSQSNESNA